MLNSNSYLTNSPGREKNWNSADRMYVGPREGTRKRSSGPTIAGGPLFSYDNHKKSLPTHLRTPKASCHDYCKYGIKYVTEDGSKGFVTECLGEEVQHKGLRQVNNLDLEEIKNDHMKTSLNLEKPNAIESRWMKESINLKRTAAVEQTIARIASESEDKSEPKTKYQAKEPAFRLNKACSPGKHNLFTITSIKGSSKTYENHRFKQTVSFPTKRIDDTTTYVAKANTIPVRVESRPAIHSSNSSRNEAYRRRNIRRMPRMVEEETVKLQMPSHSYNHADNDEPCLEAMNKNQEFQMVKPGEENNKDKTTSAIQPKVDSNSDGLKQRSNKENFGLVSVTQMSWKLEDILESSQPESLPSECVDFSSVKLAFPVEEENYPNCIERESSNDWSSHSLAYDEETEGSHSAITELTGPEDETEETEIGSDTKIDESDSAISEFSEFSELEYETERIKSGSDSETSMFRRRLKQSASVHPEENLSVPCMLKFRRRFPRKVESGNCRQVGRKDFLQMPTVEVPSDLDPEAAAFELRHQVVLEKDLRGLFNNVIEETASKLAQNRNSKVQALVRAFETVISLHSPK